MRYVTSKMQRIQVHGFENCLLYRGNFVILMDRNLKRPKWVRRVLPVQSCFRVPKNAKFPKTWGELESRKELSFLIFIMGLNFSLIENVEERSQDTEWRSSDERAAWNLNGGLILSKWCIMFILFLFLFTSRM